MPTEVGLTESTIVDDAKETDLSSQHPHYYHFLFISSFFTNIYTIFFTFYLQSYNINFFTDSYIHLSLYLLLFYPLAFLLY